MKTKTPTKKEKLEKYKRIWNEAADKIRNLSLSENICEKKEHLNFRNSFNYSVLHKYMKARIKKPEVCQICKKKGFLELAFKNHKAGLNTPQLYTRNPNDWFYICRSCHMKLDGRYKQVKNEVCSCGKKITHNQYGKFHFGGGRICQN